MTILIRSLSRYPYKSGKYGIDFSRFEITDFRDSATDITGSGRTFTYRFEDRGVSVYDPSIFPFNLRGYELSSHMSNDETINFSLFTLWSGFWHHPDMFASIFVELSIKHFEDNGFLVRNWVDEWYPYSVNFKSYTKSLRGGLNESEAAVKTWSGRQAHKSGFKPVGEVPGTYAETNAIVYKFSRR